MKLNYLLLATAALLTSSSAMKIKGIPSPPLTAPYNNDHGKSCPLLGKIPYDYDGKISQEAVNA